MPRNNNLQQFRALLGDPAPEPEVFLDPEPIPMDELREVISTPDVLEDTAYEVERIRGYRGPDQYLVQWKNYERANWIPFEQLLGSAVALSDYWNSTSGVRKLKQLAVSGPHSWDYRSWARSVQQGRREGYRDLHAVWAVQVT